MTCGERKKCCKFENLKRLKICVNELVKFVVARQRRVELFAILVFQLFVAPAPAGIAFFPSLCVLLPATTVRVEVTSLTAFAMLVLSF